MPVSSSWGRSSRSTAQPKLLSNNGAAAIVVRLLSMERRSRLFDISTPSVLEVERVLFWLGKVKRQSSAGRLQPQRHQKLLDYPKKLLRLDWLLQVRRVRGRSAPMEQIVRWVSRDIEHGEGGVALAQSLAQGSSIQLRHQHVGDDEVEVRIRQGHHAQSLAAMVRFQGTVTGLIEDPGKGPANHVFVLDHQDDPWLVSGYQWLAQKSLRGGWGPEQPQASCLANNAGEGGQHPV